MKRIFTGVAVLIAVAIMSHEGLAQQRRRGRGATATPSRQQQTGAAPARALATEPVRALGGSMIGNKIEARMSDNRLAFSYIITGAQVVDGKLQLTGTVNSQGRANGPASTIEATLVGTLSRARNPWPSATSSGRPTPSRPRPAGQVGAPEPQPQGSEARNPETAGQISQLSQATQSTARTTQTPTAPEGRSPERGEVTEQTQSLYTAVDTGSGCEVLFLKMNLPAQLTAGVRVSRPAQVGVVLAPIDNKSGEEINQHVCRIMRSLNAGQKGGDVAGQVAQLNNVLSAIK